MKHSIEFVASGRGKAQCAPDPAYPHGKPIDMAGNRPSCEVTLPYPAPECGRFEVKCQTCGLTVLITAAGRPDDPTTIRIPCETKAGMN